MSTAPKNDIISTVKEWASPALIAIVGTLLYSDLSELKSDVKTLLIQQSVDRTRIEMLERDIQILEQNRGASVASLDSTIAFGMGIIPMWMRIGPFKKEDEIDYQSESEPA